jgi:hypothetical protein
MTETAYVRQLRKAISGEFYYGIMYRETRRRIAISTDASEGRENIHGRARPWCPVFNANTSPVRQSRHNLLPASRMGMTVPGLLLSAGCFLRGLSVVDIFLPGGLGLNLRRDRFDAAGSGARNGRI